ncbi:MAG: NAD(P)/FAD-dependent oxidoreductase, partial [Alphaproteobacteria bacterium]
PLAPRPTLPVWQGATRLGYRAAMARQTFPAYADRSGFNALLPPRAPRPRAEGDVVADHVVVGAGYTGLAAARRLAQLRPQARILLLEATQVGEGSSARNSGFASPRDMPSGTSAADRAGTAATNRFGEEGWAWLMEQVEAHRIDCALRLSGRLKGAATALGAAQVDALQAAVEAAGLPCERLDRAALEARIGTSYYSCALFTPEGYVLDPAALVRGLADALPANVALHEDTPLLSLARRDGRWELATPAARIVARDVLLATNAAIRHLGYLRDLLVTIHTYAALSAALAPADVPRLGSAATWGLLPSHRLGTTVRRVGADRRMVRSR